MLAEPLPPSLSSAVAFFGDIGPVCLEKTNEFNLSGIIPRKYDVEDNYEVVPCIVEKYGNRSPSCIKFINLSRE